ncbi:unnamed protein product [Blepharisma stoltei]|uniref:Uncharacterized protein n=1 Tax=Blepharisma stoltei TaxID=1481888 RepID=A0AAU9IQY3_9CILI|nr:unnamed protein product [Blepharisma stoltei]
MAWLLLQLDNKIKIAEVPSGLPENIVLRSHFRIIKAFYQFLPKLVTAKIPSLNNSLKNLRSIRLIEIFKINFYKMKQFGQDQHKIGNL